jgi:hypothetical protein
MSDYMEIRLLMGESVGILTLPGGLDFGLCEKSKGQLSIDLLEFREGISELLPKAHFGLKARSVLSFSERVAISMLKVHFSRTMSSVKRCMQS